jgi:alkylhydroperoxidase/carboxymuconolactone decarboxylase family protein YurZ
MTERHIRGGDERLEAGLETLRALELELGKEHGLLHGMRVHTPAFKRSTIESFGVLYGSEQPLGRELRLLVALGLAAADSSAAGVLEFQIGAALKAGWSRAQIGTVLEVVAAYVGRPRAIEAARVAVRVFEGAGELGTGPSAPKRHELRAIGSYLPLDSDGNIICDCRAEHVPAALAARTVEYYRERFGDRVVSVYVRGSVARGTAVPHVSDFDAFAVLALDAPAPRVLLAPAELEQFRAIAPELRDFELNACTVSDVVDRYQGTWPFIVKTQATCIAGKDFAPDLRPYRPGPAIMGEALYLKQRLELYERRLAEDADDAARVATCEWMMKALVRAAFDLTMERLGRYTRDLYLCHAAFAAVYPERMELGRRALQWAVNPTSEVAEQRQVARELGGWVIGEAGRQCRAHDINLSQYRL